MRSKTASLRAEIGSDSQNPVGLSNAASIMPAGGVAPSKWQRPASADVPLRCMPRIRTICRIAPCLEFNGRAGTTLPGINGARYGDARCCGGLRDRTPAGRVLLCLDWGVLDWDCGPPGWDCGPLGWEQVLYLVERAGVIVQRLPGCTSIMPFFPGFTGSG